MIFPRRKVRNYDKDDSCESKASRSFPRFKSPNTLRPFKSIGKARISIAKKLWNRSIDTKEQHLKPSGPIARCKYSIAKWWYRISGQERFHKRMEAINAKIDEIIALVARIAKLLGVENRLGIENLLYETTGERFKQPQPGSTQR